MCAAVVTRRVDLAAGLNAGDGDGREVFRDGQRRWKRSAPKTASFPAKILKDYQDRLDVSWIFHDNALEGVVLSFSELKAAIDQRIISDVTLIPMYEEVRNHKTAVDFVREASVAKKPPAVDLDLVRKLYAILTPEEAAEGLPVPAGEPASPALLSRDRAAREDHLPDAQARRVDGVGRIRGACTRSPAP